jgi:hypothetical protein
MSRAIGKAMSYLHFSLKSELPPYASRTTLLSFIFPEYRKARRWPRRLKNIVLSLSNLALAGVASI